MGYAARERRLEKRFEQWHALNASSMAVGKLFVGRWPVRQIRKPRRHVYKFHEPSFTGEPWFFRKRQ